MRLSKTGLRVLNAQYRAVLRKCFLLNACAFAAIGMMGVANAATVIDSSRNNDQQLLANDPTLEGLSPGFHTNDTNDFADSDLTISTDVYAQFDYTVADGQTIKVDGSKLNISGPYGGPFPGGGQGTPSNTLKVTGGTINATGSSTNFNESTGIYSEGMIISGGAISLKNASLLDEGNYGTSATPTSITISGGSIEMSSEGVGTSTIESHGWLDGEDANGDDIIKGGIINVSGGSITVKGGTTDTSTIEGSNYLLADKINISGGTLNVESGANLKTSTAWNVLDKRTINLTDTGVINLSGGLFANIDGNNDGNINFKTSGGKIDGNVEDVNLNFEASHTLSNAITGAIGDLASLAVKVGTLVYDKTAESIGALSIADGAGLNVKNAEMTVDNTFELEAGRKLEINDGTVWINGDGTASPALTISGGEVLVNRSANNSNEVGLLGEGINITGGTISLNNAFLSDDQAKGVSMSGGAITMQTSGSGFSAVSSEKNGTINMSGGSITVKGGNNTFNSSYAGSNFLQGANINVSGGEINVESGANLKTITTINTMDKGTINLTNTGVINLSGGLLSNLTGDDRGTVNFKTSSAKIDGDVTDVNLSFDASHSMSSAITGTVNDLNNLNINTGTFTYDKKTTGTITTVNVASGATLDIGDKTLVSTGDVAGEGVKFADNSTLAFTITDKTQYGKINAEIIDISTNGTKLNLTLNKSALAKDEKETFNVLNATSLTGKFETLSEENARYTFVDKGNGVFEVTGKASASDIVQDAGGSANNVGTAEAWDSVSASSTSNPTIAAVATTLAQLSNSSSVAEQQTYVNALTALAPDVAPMVTQTTTETTNQIFGAVGTRLSGGSIAGASKGMSSGDNPFKQVAVWVQGLMNKSKLDDTKKAKGFDADTYGVAMGIEKQIDNSKKFGIGYAFSNTDVDGFMRDTDVDTHTAIVYGEYKPSNWYVNAIATYGWSDYSEKKNVAGVNVKADYDVESFGLQAMTGYDFNVNNTILTPEAGLRYVHINQKSYKDSADQRVSGDKSDILTGVIGAKVSKEWTLENNVTVKPELRVAATYDMVNDKNSSVVTLANGSAYTVNGKALDRFGMEFGAGITTELNDNVEMSLGYEGKFREDYQDHTGLVNFKYKF